MTIIINNLLPLLDLIIFAGVLVFVFQDFVFLLVFPALSDSAQSVALIFQSKLIHSKKMLRLSYSHWRNGFWVNAVNGMMLYSSCLRFCVSNFIFWRIAWFDLICSSFIFHSAGRLVIFLSVSPNFFSLFSCFLFNLQELSITINFQRKSECILYINYAGGWYQLLIPALFSVGFSL